MNSPLTQLSPSNTKYELVSAPCLLAFLSSTYTKHFLHWTARERFFMPCKKAGRASKGPEVLYLVRDLFQHLIILHTLVPDLSFPHWSLSTSYFFSISNKHEEQFVSILSTAVCMYLKTVLPSLLNSLFPGLNKPHPFNLRFLRLLIIFASSVWFINFLKWASQAYA